MPYKSVGRVRALKGAALLLLLLVGQGTQVDGTTVASAQLLGAASPCVVLPKLPLSVAFRDGLPMQSPQSQDTAIRDVLRGVKSWLCGSATVSPALYADSLRNALEQRQALIFEQVRFDTRLYQRADVLVTDSRIVADRRHEWHVQVDRTSGHWRVMHAVDAPPSLFSE